MARNGSGTYTLPEPAFVPNTPISSAAVNSDLGDIANALTGSVAADGQTTITAALKLDNAGLVYGSDPNTGVRRTAADTQAIMCGGIDALVINTAGITSPSVDSPSIKMNGSPILPPGFTGHTASSTAPPGWLIRDGAAVSRTTYAALFAAIGTTYGSGDGSTTFNVPDARGRADVGIDGGTNRLPGYVLANTGGTATNTLSQANLPNATLAVSTTGTINVTSLVGNIVQGVSSFGAQGGGAPINIPSATGAVNSAGPNSMSGSTASINGNVAQTTVGNVQPSMALTPIIKT